MQKFALIVFSVILLFAIGCTCNISGGRVYLDCYGDLLPCTSLVYNLGSPTAVWHETHSEVVNTVAINTGGSDLYVDCGVNHTIQLITPVYDDLAVLLSQVRLPETSAPSWAGYQGSQVPAFSESQINVMYFSVQLPHTYLEGSNIEFHLHMVHPDSNAGDSRWYFTYSWANTGDDFPATSNATIIHPSPTNADQHEKVEIVASIDGTGKDISSVLLCSITRTGNHADDTYANWIYLVSADFHYQVDTMGSRTMLMK